MKRNNERIYPEIEAAIRSLRPGSIPQDRKDLLAPLARYVKDRLASGKTVNLNFICTHNSRRSHLAQVWAQTIAYYMGIKDIFCYSGGTEATALFPVAAQTLVSTGFQIERLSATKNPVYGISFSDNRHPIIGFSKTYDDPFNPKSDFGAIMTCSSADLGCPMVLGAEKRFPITYEDPKSFDNTSLQEEKYNERSLQIATELLFVFKEAIV